MRPPPRARASACGLTVVVGLDADYATNADVATADLTAAAAADEAAHTAAVTASAATTADDGDDAGDDGYDSSDSSDDGFEIELNFDPTMLSL